MAQVTFTIPDAVVSEYVSAFCDTFGYQTEINGQPNPETRAQFARRMWRQMAQDVYRRWLLEQDLSAARTTSLAKPDLPVT
jgi:hypothetical protein